METLPKKLTYQFKKSFPRLSALYLIFSKKSYLYNTGWLESQKRGYPCNKDGLAIPWMNYSVVAFLGKNLSKDLSLFEYGSGYSTFFYSRQVNKVFSVEYDDNWYRFMNNNKPKNVELFFQKKDNTSDYCQIINQIEENIDVIVVDGIDRVNCIKESIGRLSEKGVIILDDSHRTKYLEGIDYAKERGFFSLDFEGLKPNDTRPYSTTILYRPNNCLNL